MITPVLHLLRLLPFLCGGHRRLAIENLALRQQLAVYKRTAPPPRARNTAPPLPPPPFLCRGHRRLAIENLALRQQLAVYKRTAPRPRLRTTDRLFWVGLARAWTGWGQAPGIVAAPHTVL